MTRRASLATTCYQLARASGPKRGILLIAQETFLYSTIYKIGRYSDIWGSFSIMEGFVLCPAHLGPSVPDVCLSCLSSYPVVLV